MVDNNEWAINELSRLSTQKIGFIEKATLVQARQIVKEQQKRIEQAEDELDGRSWSPMKW